MNPNSQPPYQAQQPTPQTPQPFQQPPQPQQPVAPATPNVPFYRSYWVFGAIYLLLTPIIGLIILLTGDIYRKQKDGQVQPIRKREKVTLTIVAFLLWGFLIFSRLHSAQTNNSAMVSWLNANKTAYNASNDSINSDVRRLQSDQGNKDATINDSHQLVTDIQTARSIPTMPDSVAAGYFSNYLDELGKAANSTIDYANTQSSSSAQATTQYISQSNDSQTKLQNRFTADGLVVQ